MALLAKTLEVTDDFIQINKGKYPPMSDAERLSYLADSRFEGTLADCFTKIEVNQERVIAVLLSIDDFKLVLDHVTLPKGYWEVNNKEYLESFSWWDAMFVPIYYLTDTLLVIGEKGTIVKIDDSNLPIFSRAIC
jgi:hypothetical protein